MLEKNRNGSKEFFLRQLQRFGDEVESSPFDFFFVRRPIVNFASILRAAFPPILLHQNVYSQTLSTVKLGYNELGC
jgi:hypothetical protein